MNAARPLMIDATGMVGGAILRQLAADGARPRRQPWSGGSLCLWWCA
jgi:hypothetical protein